MASMTSEVTEAQKVKMVLSQLNFTHRQHFFSSTIEAVYVTNTFVNGSRGSRVNLTWFRSSRCFCITNYTLFENKSPTITSLMTSALRASVYCLLERRDQYGVDGWQLVLSRVQPLWSKWLSPRHKQSWGTHWQWRKSAETCHVGNTRGISNEKSEKDQKP